MGEFGINDLGEPGEDLDEFGRYEPGRGDRRGDELDADVRELTDGGEVDVAGEHHDPRRLGRLQQQPLAGGGISVPLVEVEHRPVGQRHVAEHRLLGDHRPRRRRRGELLTEPLLLSRAEHGARRIGCLRAGRIDGKDDVAARLIRAELAPVEEDHVGERPPSDRPIGDRVGGAGGTRDAHGHVLPPGLIGREAASHELLRRVGVFGRRRGVVVLDLVVVPDRHPRARPASCLQVRIGEVQGVALAVLVERERLAAAMAAHNVATEVPPVVLVDEVAEEDDEVGRPRREVGVGGEVPGLVVLATRRGQPELGRIGAGRGDPPDRAHRVPGAEAKRHRAVDVDDDVDAVRLVRPRHDLSRVDDRRERLVVGELPRDGDVASVERRSVRLGEPGPQHGGPLVRVAGAHPQREGVVINGGGACGAPPSRTDGHNSADRKQLAT